MAPTIAAGFSEPVFQSQAAFRALLAALSEPGLVQTLPTAIMPPDGLDAPTATALLTLADYETPIWLPQPLRDGAAGAWLRFHCGAAILAETAGAAFGVIDGARETPLLAAFDPGNDQFPDRSATIFVQCAALTGGTDVILSGPGIDGSRSIAPLGLRPGFWTEVAANADLYPLGVDIVLTCGDALIGLPRTTQIRES